MKDLLTRRNILIGAGGAVVAAGATFEAGRLLRKRYAPSPYDDLLARLDDRDGDVQIGEAVLADIDDFDAKAAAVELRARLQRNTLAQAVSRDAVEGRLLEARGWVVPETLGLLCALAAKAAA
ncbi:MAG: hypothetical protein KGJ79_13075 [Alphaproteobacteria bacterium]|nr:hypothetical protein [Alphaproteobacteria bacterium]MDE2112070.1 hypothetical protein [Alphaproteobacteria bacterium]MDE2492454.1 hypothetical protein [Alphaproteobacteria bacterium]